MICNKIKTAAVQIVMKSFDTGHCQCFLVYMSIITFCGQQSPREEGNGGLICCLINGDLKLPLFLRQSVTGQSQWQVVVVLSQHTVQSEQSLDIMECGSFLTTTGPQHLVIQETVKGFSNCSLVRQKHVIKVQKPQERLQFGLAVWRYCLYLIGFSYKEYKELWERNYLCDICLVSCEVQPGILNKIKTPKISQNAIFCTADSVSFAFLTFSHLISRTYLHENKVFIS